MRSIFILLLFIPALYYGVSVVDDLHYCCSLGSDWIEKNTQCDNVPTPVSGVNPENQFTCITALGFCCRKKLYVRSCDAGKTAAKQGQECLAIQEEAGGDYHRDCCDCCKLGITLGGMGMSCDLKKLGSPCDDIFLECCLFVSAQKPERPSQIDTTSDRCRTNNPCAHECRDTGVAIQCSCQDGYRLLEDKQNCEDIDECILGTDSCDRHKQVCQNIAGSFRCEPRETSLCPPGFKTSSSGQCEDINECTEGLHECDPVLEYCLNTIGQFECHLRTPGCPAGYKQNPITRTCEDVNECAEKLDSCHIDTEICINLEGSYDCQLLPDMPEGSLSLSLCPPGFRFSKEAETCVDVDECSESTENCSKTSEDCVNTIGSFTCQKKSYRGCPPGYSFKIETKDCVDIDECAEGLDNCNRGTQICVNSYGSFQCQTITVIQCAPGFKFNAVAEICDDVDECAEQLDNCDRSSEHCINVNGGYDCQAMGHHQIIRCSEGFRINDAETGCVDVDECAEGSHNCDREKDICINKQGSFSCQGAKPIGPRPCSKGYRYNHELKICNDIDECDDEEDDCDHDRENCINTPGSFKCEPLHNVHNCPSGFRFYENRGCIDIDECAEGADNCDKNTEKCTNSPGSFACHDTNRPSAQCSPGTRYNFDLRRCVDIDECQENLHSCILETEDCVNTPGSFTCLAKVQQTLTCSSGYRYSRESRTCVDIDECSEAFNDCQPATQRCINTIGGYQCQSKPQEIGRKCSQGLRFNYESRACQDIDECADNTHTCNISQECVNEFGTYRCRSSWKRVCSSGYQLNQTTQVCEDINECILQIDTCIRGVEECVNNIGSYICKRRCQIGYKYNSQTRSCVDIDECLENTHNCHQEHYYCINNVGSFYCRCSDGFQYNSGTQRCEDINECILGRDTCRIGQRCENTIGSFTCSRELSCGTGYTLNRDSGHCEDDDECKLGTHNCGVAYSCRNTAGSFRCDVKTCPQGYRLNPHTGACDRVECGEGMEPDNFGQCIDINECLEANVCRRNQRCINMIGSYRCQSLLNCGGGYEVSEDGSQCVDIDECAKNTHNCPGGQMCFNRPGGYVCQCPQGYVINRSTRQCEDIDECTRFANTVCPSNAECQNSQGSYRCNCKEGFRNADDGRNCIDINECERNPCQHQCLNLWGSYQCSCESGYQLRSDNRSCQDIDECSIWAGRGRLCIGQCVNEPGSYSCSCPSGYTLQQDKRTCQDIDECKQNQCQGENEICLNTRGGYKCYTIHCPPQYVRDTEHKNRCKRSTLVCSQGDMECLKAPISISYSYLTFHSELSIPPSGQIDLFTMRGPLWSTTSAQFELKLNSARAPQGIQPATRESFSMRRSSFNQAVISLNQQLKGPQEIELELQMKLYHNGMYGGVAVSYIYIYVSQYNF